MKHNITVVYLMYVPYGFNAFQSFFESYKKYKTGVEHNLVIIFKGVNGNPNEIKKYKYSLQEKKIDFKYFFFDGGFDIDTYFFAANKLQCDYLFFLNTQSNILCDNWLLNSYNQMELNPDVAVVGSTASYMSYYSTVFIQNKLNWEFKKSVSQNIKKYKLLLKAFLVWKKYFAPFPNPHLRTNAFLVRRAVFLNLKYTPLTNKFDAYLYESGKKGFTNQILKMGYTNLLVDKNGIPYSINDWNNSKTFWQFNQDGLMISDNQTELYRNASIEEKENMKKLAWGKK